MQGAITKVQQKTPVKTEVLKRRQPDLNWWSGCCRPTPYRLAMSPYSFHLMTPRGFEPLLPPWKGGVLTAWPWSRMLIYYDTYSHQSKYIFEKNSPSWARTNNPSVNSRMLYHWAIEEYKKVYTFKTPYCINIQPIPLMVKPSTY